MTSELLLVLGIFLSASYMGFLVGVRVERVVAVLTGAVLVAAVARLTWTGEHDVLQAAVVVSGVSAFVTTFAKEVKQFIATAPWPKRSTALLLLLVPALGAAVVRLIRG